MSDEQYTELDIYNQLDPADRASYIDYPCSPLFAALYAGRGLTPPIPANFPLRVSTPAPWEHKPIWPDYDPRKVDIGQNSPLWDGIRHLWPSDMQKKEVQAKLAKESDKKAGNVQQEKKVDKPKIQRSRALN